MLKTYKIIEDLKSKYKSDIVFDTRLIKKNDIFIGLKTKNNDEKKISTHGVFVAIGHDPATKPFKNVLELDNEGYIKVNLVQH